VARTPQDDADDAKPDGAKPDDATPDDATPSDAAPSDAAPSDAAPSDAAPSDAAPSDATAHDAPSARRGARSDERRDLVRLWAVTGTLVATLGAVAIGLGGAPLEHARVEVELGEAGALDDEALATTVAFSDPFELDVTRTVSILTRSEHHDAASGDAAPRGALLAALVDLATDAVREIEIELGDTGHFARVPPGRYVVRLTGRGEGRALGVVRSGGVPWRLTALAAFLLLAPAIWRSLAHRSRRP